MGGLGSGLWERRNVKTTVEQCYSLDINKLANCGGLLIGASGILYWTNPYNMSNFSVAFSIASSDRWEKIVEISYRLVDFWSQSNSDNILIHVRVEATHPYFGGTRWWFICPLTVGDTLCNRRVGKLYRPRGARYFGCRHCHDLTYQSCQESHQLERLLAAPS